MDRPGEAQTILAGARILVVDDEFMIALDLEMLLLEAGAAQVLTCASLAEGLDAARTAPIDAAVLDVRLGAETSEPVAAALAARAVPFIFYSGQPLAEVMRRAYPGVRLIAKPAPEATLVLAMRETLDCGHGTAA